MVRKVVQFLVITTQVISSVLGGVAVLLLGAIGRLILAMRKDFHKFMAEHLWLLATTMWNKDKIILIMKKLDMPIEDLPPTNLIDG